VICGYGGHDGRLGVLQSRNAICLSLMMCMRPSEDDLRLDGGVEVENQVLSMDLCESARAVRA
jgi:hypothetical protein